MNERCGNCLFFVVGTCRRYPPTVTFTDGGNFTARVATFPRVDDYSWCGEFKSVPKK